MKKQSISLREMAKGMVRSHTTLSREFQRNTGQKGYRYDQAQHLADHRHQEKAKAVKLTSPVRAHIQEKLQAPMEPRANLLAVTAGAEAIALSQETVYRFMLKEKQHRGQLYRSLRHQPESHRKGYGRKDYLGTIPGRVDIANRPAVVDTRSRVEDFEADVGMGKEHQGTIVTLAERRARLLLALPILRKTAELTTRAMTTLLAVFKDWTHTIPYDNGREFRGMPPLPRPQIVTDSLLALTTVGSGA